MCRFSLYQVLRSKSQGNQFQEDFSELLFKNLNKIQKI